MYIYIYCNHTKIMHNVFLFLIKDEDHQGLKGTSSTEATN